MVFILTMIKNSLLSSLNEITKVNTIHEPLLFIKRNEQNDKCYAEKIV